MRRGDGLRFDRVERRGSTRHRSGMPVLELSAGEKHRRIVRIGTLRGRDEIGRHEPAAAIRGWETLDKHDRVAGVAFLEAGIRYGRLSFEAFPCDAGDGIHAGPHFGEYVTRVRVLPVQSHALCQFSEKPEVLFGLAWRLDRLASKLHH